MVFVFATTEVHKIPTTILSRCQRFDFKLISTARLTEHLDDDPGAPRRSTPTPEAVRLIARQAAGSVRDGAVAARPGRSPTSATEPLTARGRPPRCWASPTGGCSSSWRGAVLDRDPGAALRLIARAADRGVDLGQLARSFLGFLRDLEVVAR